MSDKLIRGVLYVAHKPNFVQEALISAESVKKHNPDLHITFFTDQKIDSPFVDDYKLIGNFALNDRRSKIENIKNFPYHKTLFLDSDTIINYKLDDMFDLLDTFDLAMIHDLARKRKKYSNLIPAYGEIPYSFSEVNTGVMAIVKNEKTDFLFNLWKENFYKYYRVCPYDQPSFRISLWESIKQKDLKLYVLPPEYNIRSKANREKQRRFHHEFGEDHLTPRIYHMHVDTNITRGAYPHYTLDEAVEYVKENHMEY